MASQDRSGHFSTELFEHHQRSERTLVGALAEGAFGWREGRAIHRPALAAPP